MSDQPRTQCPGCGAWVDDFDGFGVLAHTKPAYEDGCGYCSHPSRDGEPGVCGICGDVEKYGARKTMEDLACERGDMAASLITDYATEVGATRGNDNRLLFECLILEEQLTWDPDRYEWDGPIVDVLARIANEAIHAKTEQCESWKVAAELLEKLESVLPLTQINYYRVMRVDCKAAMRKARALECGES